MLEGLSHSHPLVIALDDSRRLVWLSDEFGFLFPNAVKCVGHPIQVLIDEMAVKDIEKFRADAEAFVDELHRTGRVGRAVFDVGEFPTVARVESSAFLFETDDGNQLSVSMSRRLAPEAPMVAERTPLDSNSRLAIILDATPDAILVVDRLGFVTSANAAAGRILGYPAEKLIDQPITLFLKESERLQGIAHALAERGVIESEEVEIARVDGSRVWLSISARTHQFARTDGTETTETILLMRDVTERRLANQALERKNEELENCVRSVAHDLRSPLASLLGFTRLLREDHGESLGESGNRFLERIEDSGRNMDQLLHGMLELSRIGVAPMRRAAINPALILDQLRAELKLRLEEGEIELTTPSDPPVVRGDPTQIYQLFANLMSNAVAHMPTIEERRRLGWTERARVEVGIEPSPAGWTISVADNGLGIAHEDQERIFEMFQSARPSGSSSTHKSTGLGLSIVKKIVESNGGTIRVESAPNEGARFIVFLPKDLPSGPASTHETR